MPGDLTKDFSFSEFLVSMSHPHLAEGIGFTEQDRFKCFLLARMILQPVRDFFQMPIRITSGKRSKKLNEEVGGISISDHLFEGFSAACDWLFVEDPGAKYLRRAFRFIAQKPECFGQLILELDSNEQPENIHVSLPSEKHLGECLIRASDKHTFTNYDPVHGVI